MTQSANSTSTAKISTFVLAAIYITLVLSFVAIAVAVGALIEGSTEVAVYLLAIGFIALALSGYYLFQSRKHVANLKIDAPKILTTIECIKCGIKSTREFQRGDFVYKELDKCTKCEDKQVITAIYREATQKEQKEKDKPITV
jgi:multidrug transporter EmrE-like cation transporter